MKPLTMPVAYCLVALGFCLFAVLLSWPSPTVAAQKSRATIRIPLDWATIDVPDTCNDCRCVEWGIHLGLWRERYRMMDGPGGDLDLRMIARLMP